MELFFPVDTDDGSADVKVVADPAHRVSDLIAALGGHLGIPSASSLWRDGDPEPLATDATLSDVGLISGERLGLLSDESFGLAQVFRSRGIDQEFAPGGEVPDYPHLVVVSGYAAGRSIPVGPLSRVVGRSRECDLSVEDPQISRRQFTIVAVADGSVEVTPDPSSSNAVRLNGTPVHEAFPLGLGDVIAAGQTSLTLRKARPTSRAREFHSFGTVPFRRTPYFRRPIFSASFDEIEVPSKPSRRRFNYIATLAPLLFGIGMAVGLGNPRFLFFAAMSPLIAVANFIDQRWISGKEHRSAVQRFEESVANRRAEIEVALESERRSRSINAPDIGSLAERAQRHLKDLWVRGRGVPDFLHLRIGVGDVVPRMEVPEVGEGDVELVKSLTEAQEPAGLLTDVPIVIDAIDLGTIGMIGESSSVEALTGALLLEAVCLHSPEDLVVAGVVSSERQLRHWLQWLPHTRSAGSPLGIDHLATTREGGTELLYDLAEIAEERTSGREGNLDRRWPWLLVVLDSSVVADGGVTARLLDAGPAAGVTVLWMCESEDEVPRQAGAVIVCTGGESSGSRIEFVDPDRPGISLDIERVGLTVALNTAHALAGVRDASATNAVTAIPQLVTLFEVLGVDEVTPEWIQRLWDQNGDYELRAPVGFTETGVFEVDLVAHGPHGLIGGTSGAGKSELLQSLLAGLVTYNSPSRVNLLFIDYKGGALSRKFETLPHMVGNVTNLDSLLAQRALTSLVAELNYRMALFGSRDMRKMIEERVPDTPASLVIVIDEFAALVRELPEFIEGIVSIAERGRSLGIHLLLSTQRPSGSINDSIQQNTNLRIALRMLDSSESNNVIGTSDAALIPNPLKGRALARLGAGQLVPFQVAWSEAPAISRSRAEIEVEDFMVGSRSEVGSSRLADASPLGAKCVQLESVISVISDMGVVRGRSPWLDPLPERIPLSGVLDWEPRGDRPTGMLRIGIVDDPERQSQYPAEIDFRVGSFAVFGAARSGKTTVLSTIAASAARTVHDGSLMIFGLDCASKALGVIGALPYTVDIASGDELEEVTRVIALLNDLFLQRRGRLRLEDQVSFSPVLVLVDGWDNLIATLSPVQGGGMELQSWLDVLSRVVSRGREVGIYSALTSSERLRSRLMNSITSRLVLRQLGEGEYRELGIPAVLARGLALRPGQGLNNSNQLVQVATAVEGADLDPRSAFEKLGSRLPAGRVEEIRCEPLPTTINRTTRPRKGVAIGIADLSLETVEVDISATHLAISGPPRSGRTTVLRSIAHQLRESGEHYAVIGPHHSPLSSMDWERGLFGAPREIATFLTSLMESSPVEGMLFVLIDEIRDIEDRSIHPVLQRMLSHNVRFVAVGDSFRRVSMSNPLLPVLRDTRTSMHLQPTSREIAEVIQTRFALRPGLEMPPGRGVLVMNRMPVVVQSFLC